ncbi:MAG: phytanoyl-CoA dioxygenase family protein [Spirulinaceae cyanobacterium]
MLLTEKQLNYYHQNGFLILENHFDLAEMALLKREMTQLSAYDRPGRVLEKNGAVRTIFAPHHCNQVFKALPQLPRLLRPARQILQSEVYIHQYKLNTKAALDGKQWEWHQDFLYWHKEDNMLKPKALNVVIFLEEVNDFNGPLLVIPGSHNRGIVELKANQSGWKSTLTADLKYKIDKQTLAELVKDGGIFAIKGLAGLVVLFHCNLFHASAGNLSPWNRFSTFITYNSLENKLEENENPRPEFIASRDFTAVQTLSEQALVEAAHGNFVSTKEIIEQSELIETQV